MRQTPKKRDMHESKKNNDVRMLATLTPERLWNVIPIPFLRTLISIASCMTPLKKSSSAMGANMTKVNISKNGGTLIDPCIRRYPNQTKPAVISIPNQKLAECLFFVITKLSIV